MDTQPPEITPHQAEFFPISAESVNKGLNEISQSPDKVLTEESFAIDVEDPELSKLVSAFAESSLINRDLSFYEGALWIRKIMKLHAVSQGAQMPKLTREAGFSYLASNLEKLKGSSMSVNEHFLSQIDSIKGIDPELYRGIEVMAKYKSHKGEFLGGAAVVYTSLKRMDDASKLSNSLQYNS